MTQKAQQAQQEQEKREALKEQKKAILQQVLTNEARDRLSNIAVVKPQKADQLENVIIQNATRGMLQGKVSEQQLIDLLEQVNERQAAQVSTTIKFQRKRFDEDDLDDLI